MSRPAIPLGGVPVSRRVMFVLELHDPVTGTLMGDDFEVRAEGLGAPRLTRQGALVWLDIDPPADRTVIVRATARSGQFAAFEEELQVPKRTQSDRVRPTRRELRPTGLYQPPAGRLAAAGMLIEEESVRKPLPDAEVVLILSPSRLGGEIRSTFVSRTDERGGFVAVSAGFDGNTPLQAPRPAPDGSVTGTLEVTWRGLQRQTKALALRCAQLNHLPEPLIWADLR